MTYILHYTHNQDYTIVPIVEDPRTLRFRGLGLKWFRVEGMVSERTQYHLIKEYALNQSIEAPII